MGCEDAERENQFKKLAGEETVRERMDKNGHRWIKVYVGSGEHFRNWLSQFVELNGEENVQTEEADATGFECYEESGEKMYRIWVKETETKNKTVSAILGRKESIEE